MDNEIKKPEVIEDTKRINTQRIKKFIVASVIICVVSITLSAAYFFLVSKNTLPNFFDLQIPFSQVTRDNEVIAKVGVENFYKNDLNYYLNVYFPNKNDSTSVQKSIDALIEQSIILQQAEKDSLIKLSSTTFNNSNKNIALRSALLEEAKKKLEEKYVTRISGEAITMWFNNPSYPKPRIGVDAAKQLVRQKVDNFRQALIAGKITLIEAGNKISNDKEQSRIDPSHKENSYLKFTNINRSDKFFFDPKINDLVWSLEKNEFSNITVGQDSISSGYGGPLQDAYFIIVKINNKSGLNSNTFNDWLNDIKKQYKIEKY